MILRWGWKRHEIGWTNAVDGNICHWRALVPLVCIAEFRMFPGSGGRGTGWKDVSNIGQWFISRSVDPIEQNLWLKGRGTVASGYRAIGRRFDSLLHKKASNADTSFSTFTATSTSTCLESGDVATQGIGTFVAGTVHISAVDEEGRFSALFCIFIAGFARGGDDSAECWNASPTDINLQYHPMVQHPPTTHPSLSEPPHLPYT